MMRKSLILLVVLTVAASWGGLAHGTSGKITLDFSTAVDGSATVDRLIHCALQRLKAYDMSVEAYPMTHAIQTANSGEKDALAVQLAGLEREYPNLVMVPEPISEVRFKVYARKGFSRDIGGWEDLAGLRVGTAMYKTYMESQLPSDVAEHLYRGSNAELIQALLAGECDVFIATVSLDDDLKIPESIFCIQELERLPVYTYLHKRHEALAPALAQAIADIKADGSYQPIAAHKKRSGTQQKKVLHLSSYYTDDIWEQSLMDGVKDVLAVDGNIQYQNIAMAANRSLNKSNRIHTISSMVRTAYLESAPDVVIASDNMAIQFVLDYYNVLFFDVPVVFCGQNGDIGDQLWKIGGNGTGVYEDIPAEENLRLILDLFPDTEQLFILNDGSVSGAAWRSEIEEKLETMPETKGLDITYSPEAPLSEILSVIAALPPNSVILCGSFSADSDNRHYTQRALQKELSKGCNLPIFGMRCGGIGFGQIGGRHVDGGIQGRAAADQALLVLEGQDISTIPTLRNTQSVNRWVFDYNMLPRFGIREEALPAGSVFLNKPATLYESNPRAFVLAMLLLGLALTAVGVLGLLFAKLRHQNRRLVTALKNLHSTEALLEKDKAIVGTAERLEIALAVSNSGFWELNSHTGLFYYDQTIAKALRLSPVDCIPIPQFVAHIARIQEDFAGSLYEKAMVTGDVDAYLQLNGTSIAIQDEHGDIRYYRNHTKVIAGDDGRMEYIIGLLIDITDDRKVQQELTEAKDAAESASRTKSQFLSNMSHEIRTPMNSIIGMAELLAIEPLSEKQKQCVRDISTSADWLLKLINDLLDLSKIESGKLDLVLANYNLYELMENLNSMFSYAASRKGLTFVWRKAGNLPEILFGDDMRVRQILANVINNAIKYTSEGTVEFEARCDGAHIYYTVTDTGIGIKPEDLASVYVEYAQFDLKRNRHKGGTGLGLPIAKKLVDKMGGSIQVSSVYGEGTRVEIVLPYTVGTPGEPAPKHIACRELYAPEAKILVVDDNEINLRVASGFLEHFGICCHTACSGSEAIGKIQSDRYDLVFMDHMMPDMDGIETVQALRAEGFTPELLPVVALTANAVVGVKETLLEAGMNDYLSKPINRLELGDMLQRWLPPSKVHFQKHQIQEEKSMPLPPLLLAAQKIEGIDLAQGLSFCGGDHGAYLELLRLMLCMLPMDADIMRTCLADAAWERLGIEAHGAKSAFTHIGATVLASQALQMETHAKASDVAFCTEHLPALLEGMGVLEQQLRELFAAFSFTEKKNPGEPDALRKHLAVLRDRLEAFDYDAAQRMLIRLSEADFGHDLNALLSRTADLVRLFDFSSAATVLDEIERILGLDRQ